MKLRYLLLSLATAVIAALTIHGIAQGATIKAFSVDKVVRVSDNVYTAEKNVVDTHGEPNAGDIAFQYITFKTEGCKHNPGANATAIYLRTEEFSKLIFSDGGSCKVNVVESDFNAPATK